MTATADPIEILRLSNPVPPGSLRQVAAERGQEVLRRLRANEITPHAVRPPRPRRTAYIVAAALLAAVGAGTYALATQHGTRPQTPSQPPPAGTPVQNVAEADALLPFDAVLPSNATPAYMNVYPMTLPPAGHWLSAYFDASPDGTYSLDEKPTDWTVGRLQEFGKQWKGGPADVQVVDGVHVLVGSGPAPSGAAPAGSAGEENFVIWIRGDGTSPVLTTLDGPWIEGKPFTKQQALAVATDIISQGG